MKTLALIGAIGVILLLIIGKNGPAEDGAQFEARKQECSKAIMSSIGTSTFGYADRQAYERHVKEHCDGLTLNGKPLGR